MSTIVYRLSDATNWWEILPVRGEKPTRLFQLAVSLWIVFFVVCGGKAVVSPVKHNSYSSFETGAELWLADLNMYQGSFYEFRYGPTFAFLFTPLTLLPMWLGSLLWMWFNLAAFAWALRALVRDILPGRWSPNQEGAFLILVLLATYRGFWTAQTNMLILTCLVAALLAVAQRRWAVAALFLAVPVHIKVWPAAAALLIIACWPRALTARFVAALVAVAALPLAIKWPWLVWARYADWHRALTGKMQIRHDYHDMWTLLEVFQRPDTTAYAIWQVSFGILVLASCLWQKQRGASTKQMSTFLLGIWAAWQLSFGPGTERATFGLIAPLTAWGLITAFSIERGRSLMLLAFGLTVLGGLGQVERALQPMFPLAAALHPLGIMVFAGWLLEYARDWRLPSFPMIARQHQRVPTIVSEPLPGMPAFASAA
ncbi:MAG TPA: glycosyltransferase family 87 protein [Pirellulales bacterium]|nr:glycosyltransferase family 87 protein [Pirellulales bacterium]